MKTFVRSACALVLAGLSIVCSTSFAQAPGFGGFSQRNADNKEHYACWAGSGSYPTEAVGFYNYFQSSASPIANLDILPIQPNACPALTDIKLNNTLQVPGVFGEWTCEFGYTGWDGLICIEGSINFNVGLHAYRVVWFSPHLTYYDAAFSTWCHEVGHSFGIWHEYWDGSCTKGDVAPGLSLSYTTDELYLMNYYIY